MSTGTLAKLAASALAVVLSAAFGVQFSGATFTGTSTQTLTVTSAADWAPPTVSVDVPSTALSGSATVTATASDTGGLGVANVQIQFSPADQNTWSALCTDASAPYSCSWATPQVPDGRYDLRAIATDNAGFTATSAVVPARVANNFGVVLADVPTVVKGSVTLTATLANAGLSSASYMWFEYAVAGSTNWTAVPGCGKQLLPGILTTRSCVWNTSGNLTYDVRAVAIVVVSTVHDVQNNVLVDNIAPSGTLSVAPSPLRGLVTMTSADAADGDEGSGVDRVDFQLRRSGSSTWSTIGSATDDPYSFVFDTATVADGSIDLRAVVFDVAGNSVTTPIVTRTVDNTVSTVTVSAPLNGATVRGNAVPVSASAVSSTGITSVRIDASSNNGSTWTSICTDTSAPWACTWDTTDTTTSTAFQLRAVMLETNGDVTTSAAVSVTVDNSPLRGQDVQAQNVGTLNTINANDRIILTYSGLVDLTTIKAGWNGTSTGIAASARDRDVAGSMVGRYDRIDFSDANLGQVGIVQDQVRKGRTVTFSGTTMVASTATIGGVQVTVITVTMGTPGNTSWLRSGSTSGAMRWAPSSLARSPLGAACATTLVLESGPADRDL